MVVRPVTLHPRDCGQQRLNDNATADSGAKDDTMAKHKHTLPAVTKSAKEAGQALQGLTGLALTALQHDCARVVAGLAEVSPERSLQLVSTEGSFHAVIKHGKKTFQFEGDSFAVSTHD